MTVLSVFIVEKFSGRTRIFFYIYTGHFFTNFLHFAYVFMRTTFVNLVFHVSVIFFIYGLATF